MINKEKDNVTTEEEWLNNEDDLMDRMLSNSTGKGLQYHRDLLEGKIDPSLNCDKYRENLRTSEEKLEKEFMEKFDRYFTIPVIVAQTSYILYLAYTMIQG